MKRHHLTIAAASILLTAGAASADCRAELAQLTEGVSKDGTMAPMQAEPGGGTPQTGDGTATASEGDGEGMVKDGTTAPMTADPDIATSAQDAQAQQQGGETAAAQAAGAEGDGDGAAHDDALARAQAALDAGDEAGCMDALQEVTG